MEYSTWADQADKSYEFYKQTELYFFVISVQNILVQNHVQYSCSDEGNGRSKIGRGFWDTNVAFLHDHSINNVNVTIGAF